MCNKILFGERLLGLRKAKNLTRKELCLALGFSINAYTCWEQGKNFSKIISIVSLSKYFNVTADYLLGISDVKKRPKK